MIVPKSYYLRLWEIVTQRVRDVASGTQPSAHSPLPAVILAHLRRGRVDGNRHQDQLVMTPILKFQIFTKFRHLYNHHPVRFIMELEEAPSRE